MARIQNKEILITGAKFSEDRKYRYFLYRIWETTNEFPKVMFIGLNPSKASEDEDDPTVRRCISFAKSWKYGGMYMTNLFAYISTNPKELVTSGEDIQLNNTTLKVINGLCAKVVFCWGSFMQHKKRMEEVIAMFPHAYCIDKSKNGIPKHPLYLRGDLELKRF
jgi:hypothetical protein